MARIELRDATIRIKDGFGGTGAVDDTAIAGGNTTLEIDTLANLPNGRTTVPIGARFTIAGVGSPTETVFTVTARNSNEKQQVVVDATAGNFTLTFSGQTTGNIAFDANAAAVQSALEALSNIAPGDVVVTSPVAGTWVIEFRGAYLATNVPVLTGTDVDLTGGADTITITTPRPGGTTWELTFTPALDGADLPANNDVITFLPIQIEIKIGDGNLTYTENTEYEYLLDRGDLDTVREGNEVPMDVSMEFVYEFVRTGTSEAVTPVDALKGVGGAADWSSSSADPCEPYCVDVEIEHDPPCGTAEREITLFPEFRRDSLEFDLSAATIACQGRCNATEPTITRAA
jgi:hypothetical protein